MGLMGLVWEAGPGLCLLVFSRRSCVRGPEDVPLELGGWGLASRARPTCVTWARPFASLPLSLPVREMQIMMKPQRILS